MAMNAALNEDVEAFARRENRRLLAKRRNSNTFRRGERAHPRRHDFTLLFSTVVASAIALFATPCAADCSYVYQPPYWYGQSICYSPFNDQWEIQTALQYCNPNWSNSETFENCHDYYGVHISDWDVSRVEDMNNLFGSYSGFNADISRWDVSSVTDMNSMFSNTQSFNGDLSNWNTHAVTSMSYMFQNVENFNADISRWNTQSLAFMQNMFENAKSFDADITKWTCDAYERSRTRNNVDNMFTGADAWHASYVNTHAGYFDRDLGPPNMWMPNGAYKKESTKDKVYIALFALMGTAMLAMAIYLIVRCATHRKRTAKKVTTQFRIAHAHNAVSQQQMLGMSPMPPGAPMLPGRSPIVVTLPAAAAPPTAALAQQDTEESQQV